MLTDAPSTKYGEALRAQVEERLAFYETGAAPTKNSTAMAKVLEQLRTIEVEMGDAIQDVDAESEAEEEAPKKEKKVNLLSQ